MIWILIIEIISHSINTNNTIQVLSFPTKNSCIKAEQSLGNDSYIVIKEPCYSSEDAMKKQNQLTPR